MTGPEHYIEAEQLLAAADAYEQDGAPQTAASRRAEAQVHATLAVAAATVAHASATAYAADVNLHDLNRWERVIAPPAQVDDEDEPTTADMFTGDELREMDRDAEYAMDAADDEARAADEQAGDVR